MKKVNIVDNAEHPVEKEVLSASIVAMSQAVKRIEKSGLNLEAIVVLTHHNCKSPFKFGNKPAMGEVRAVIQSLSELESRYTKP